MTKQLVRMRLADIIPYENNPRHNNNAVEAVKESIRQCEYIAPIIVDEDHIILAGHTRAKALDELGKDEADVMVVSGLTDEQKRKYRLLDNKTAEASSWDIDLLEIELEGLDFEGFDFGFDIDTEIEIEPEHKGSLAEKFLVPPFSVILGNKGDWLERKRRWVNRGIRSEIGRGGNSLTTSDQTVTAIRGGYRTKQGVQRTRRSKQHYDKSKAYSDNLIAYMRDLKERPSGNTF